MKSTTMFIIISILSTLLFNACTIQGEKVCGIWNANTALGTMKLEITPWEGKFIGYVLEYHNGKEIIKGGKDDEFVFITDLVFEDDRYKNGKIFIQEATEEYCNLTLDFINDTRIKATYDCKGEISEEIWNKEGFPPIMSKEKEEQQPSNPSSKQITDNPKEKGSGNVSHPTKTAEETKDKSPSADYQSDTQSKSEFHVIGFHQTIDYNDSKRLSNAVESLWNKVYNDDFSSKLENIADWEKMYVTYSHYDQPKGKVTITIGYAVKDLSKIPSGLHGITIPKNEYWSYPLSGKESDYEGEEWQQLEAIMAYRKKESVDFEVYSFDDNYNVKQASIWIASK